MIEITESGYSGGEALSIHGDYYIEFTENRVDLIILNTGEIRGTYHNRPLVKGGKRLKELKALRRTLDIVLEIEEEAYRIQLESFNQLMKERNTQLIALEPGVSDRITLEDYID